MTSSSFVAAHLGVTVPVVAVGSLTTATSLTVAAPGLAVLVAGLAALGAALTLGPAPSPAG